MKIRFYKFDGFNDLVYKIRGSETYIEKEGFLRDRCEIINPVMDFEYGAADGFKPFIDYNFAYIPDFSRFYFVTRFEIVRTGLIRVYFHEDVLSSFHQIIYSEQTPTYSYVVERSSLASGIVPDPLVTFSGNRSVQYTNLSIAGNPFHTQQPSFTWISRYNFILQVCADDSNFDLTTSGSQEYKPQTYVNSVDIGIGTTRFYCLTYADVELLMAKLWDSSFINDFKTLFANKSSAIISLTAFPIDFSIGVGGVYKFFNMSSVNDNKIHIGQQTVQLHAPLRILYPRSYDVGTFQIPSRDKFYQFSPYSEYSIFLPFTGWKRLPDEIMQSHYNYKITMGIDPVSLTVTYYIIDPAVSGDRIIAEYSSKIGYPVTIDSAESGDRNREKFMSAISNALSVGTSAVGLLAGSSTITAVGVTGAMKDIASGFAGTMRSDSISVRNTNGSFGNIFDPRGFILRIESPILSCDISEIRNTYGLVPDEANVNEALTKARLRTFTGYAKFAKIHLTNLDYSYSGDQVTPTAEEKSELIRLLTAGCHFKAIE